MCRISVHTVTNQIKRQTKNMPRKKTRMKHIKTSILVYLWVLLFWVLFLLSAYLYFLNILNTCRKKSKYLGIKFINIEKVITGQSQIRDLKLKVYNN